MSSPSLSPEATESTARHGGWMVVIHNNDHNTVEEVILALMAATKCGIEEAEIETWEAHTYGRARVHFACREECTEAAKVISKVGVHTEVQKEWDE